MDGRIYPRLLVTSALLLASGCASLPADRGFGDVRQAIADRGYELSDKPDEATHKLVGELLAKELDAADAVRVALVQNPKLRAEYAQLGLASADVYQAGRLSNPRFSASVLFSNTEGDANQVGFGLVQSFTDLLLLPSRNRLAKAEFQQAKLSVGAAALDLAAEVEAAYYRALGTQQAATMRRSILAAAQSSADLAQRFFDAGNITRLELAMEQASATQARLEALNADADAATARSALNGLMGLAADGDVWKLPASMHAPLEHEDRAEALVALADKSRLDLAAARLRDQALADALGVTRGYRYVGDIEVGVETERETDHTRITGPTLSLELPIFNQGADRVARGQARLDKAEAELKALELEIGNGVKLAHSRVLSARSRAEQYRTALVPQREAIVARTQEDVNYMLKGQFELLLAKQQEYDAYQGYLAAVRDYWLARVDLAHEVGTTLPSSTQKSGEALSPRVPQEPPAGMHHMHHGDMKGMNHSGHDMQNMPGMEGMEGMDMKNMDHTEQPAPKKKDPPAKREHHHGDAS